MKFIATLLCFALFIISANSQQWKLTASYGMGVPRQEMGKNIPLVHQLQAGGMYQLPGKLNQLSVGVDLGFGIYASKRIEQTFQFDNSSSIVPVIYNSNTVNAGVQSRLNLVKNSSYVIPYINAKAGLYNFFSNITVEDPADGGCHALERKNIINDKTMYWSAGGGVQIDPMVFSNKGGKQRRERVLIDLSANTVQGGTLNYINTKKLMDAQTVNDGGKPLNVQFINASTQSIHEHTVAQVYTSPLRLLEFRAGVTVVFGK